MEITGEVCNKCSSPMVLKRERFGNFLACSQYPDCKTTKPLN
ncbi:MAG: topoisomerase DNA-binding C4 zinc finger domain-containing protein [Gammaproteobacteria bacterium]